MVEEDEARVAEPKGGENAAKGDLTGARPTSGWKCVKCGESHEASDVVCWNCGTDSEGNEDPHFVEVESPNAGERGLSADLDMAVPVGPDSMSRETADDEELLTGGVSSCVRCGSERVISDAQIVSGGGGFPTSLQAVVCQDPQALLFKKPHFDDLRARICGDCGHVELRVRHPKALYRTYLESQSLDEVKREPS
jgi:hypothetical protein